MRVDHAAWVTIMNLWRARTVRETMDWIPASDYVQPAVNVRFSANIYNQPLIDSIISDSE